jgi:hypothetical protein
MISTAVLTCRDRTGLTMALWWRAVVRMVGNDEQAAYQAIEKRRPSQCLTQDTVWSGDLVVEHHHHLRQGAAAAAVDLHGVREVDSVLAHHDPQGRPAPHRSAGGCLGRPGVRVLHRPDGAEARNFEHHAALTVVTGTNA